MKDKSGKRRFYRWYPRRWEGLSLPRKYGRRATPLMPRALYSYGCPCRRRCRVYPPLDSTEEISSPTLSFSDAGFGLRTRMKFHHLPFIYISIPTRIHNPTHVLTTSPNLVSISSNPLKNHDTHPLTSLHPDSEI